MSDLLTETSLGHCVSFAFTQAMQDSQCSAHPEITSADCRRDPHATPGSSLESAHSRSFADEKGRQLKHLRSDVLDASHRSLRLAALQRLREPLNILSRKKSLAQYTDDGKRYWRWRDVVKRVLHLCRGASAEEVSLLLQTQHWLEVTDARHRHGSNLKPYYKKWLESNTDQSFFVWLDEGDGKEIDLPKKPRSKLNSEFVAYCGPERCFFEVTVENGKLRYAISRRPVQTRSDPGEISERRDCGASAACARDTGCTDTESSSPIRAHIPMHGDGAGVCAKTGNNSCDRGDGDSCSDGDDACLTRDEASQCRLANAISGSRAGCCPAPPPPLPPQTVATASADGRQPADLLPPRPESASGATPPSRSSAPARPRGKGIRSRPSSAEASGFHVLSAQLLKGRALDAAMPRSRRWSGARIRRSKVFASDTLIPSSHSCRNDDDDDDDDASPEESLRELTRRWQSETSLRLLSGRNSASGGDRRSGGRGAAAADVTAASHPVLATMTSVPRSLAMLQIVEDAMLRSAVGGAGLAACTRNSSVSQPCASLHGDHDAMLPAAAHTSSSSLPEQLLYGSEAATLPLLPEDLIAASVDPDLDLEDEIEKRMLSRGELIRVSKQEELDAILDPSAPKVLEPKPAAVAARLDAKEQPREPSAPTQADEAATLRTGDEVQTCVQQTADKAADHTQPSPSDQKWIYVWDMQSRLYIAQKRPGHFHHSSFVAGGAVKAAGSIIVENGVLKQLTTWSGHYRPTKRDIGQFFSWLQAKGVDMTEVELLLVKPNKADKHSKAELKELHKAEQAIREGDF